MHRLGRQGCGEGGLGPFHSQALSPPASRISHPPQTLEELGVSLQLLETLQHDLPGMEAQIPPIHEQFAILEKYEVPVQDSVSSRAWSSRGRPAPAVGRAGRGPPGAGPRAVPGDR